jgi:hypothetical protein
MRRARLKKTIERLVRIVKKVKITLRNVRKP